MRRSGHIEEATRRGAARFCTLVSALALACAGSESPVVDVLVPSDTQDEVGPYEVAATVSYAGDIETVRLRWFTGEGEAAPRPVVFVRQGESDLWLGSIPGQPAPSTVRFVVEVEDDEGRRVVSPGPVETVPPHSFAVLARTAAP